MTRLVVEGAVFPLGTEDLRFSPDETARPARDAAAATTAATSRPKAGWPASCSAAHRASSASAAARCSALRRARSPGPPQPDRAGLARDAVGLRHDHRRTRPNASWGPARGRPACWRCPSAVRSWSLARTAATACTALVRETVLNRLRRSPDDRATQAWSAARDLAEEAFDTVARGARVPGARPDRRRGRAGAALRRGGRPGGPLAGGPGHPRAAARSASGARIPDLSLIEARALLHHRPPAAGARGRRGGVAPRRPHRATSPCRSARSSSWPSITFASDMAAAEDWLSAADHLLRNHDLPDRPAPTRSRAGRWASAASAPRCAATSVDGAPSTSKTANGC